jgi:hypothetical protein
MQVIGGGQEGGGIGLKKLAEILLLAIIIVNPVGG